MCKYSKNPTWMNLQLCTGEETLKGVGNWPLTRLNAKVNTVENDDCLLMNGHENKPSFSVDRITKNLWHGSDHVQGWSTIK